MICIHHNKDLDGYTSGAVVKRKFLQAKMIGWDYGMDIPDTPNGEDIIMIDVSFPMLEMIKLRQKSKSLTWIDHHISAKKEFDEFTQGMTFEHHGINYQYVLGIAACEVGWNYYFPNEKIPLAVELLGQYDTWRENGTNLWNNRILPFQFYMRTICTSPDTFPMNFLDLEPDFDLSYPEIEQGIEAGRLILKYQEQQDMLNCERGAFEMEVYGGLRGLCLNQAAFSSETMKTVYDPLRHDIMIGFIYNKGFWRISLRSMSFDVNVSEIAKARGGGGHLRAAGFEVKTFEEIFI